MRNKQELEHAVDQVIEAVCGSCEIAIVTLYEFGEMKEDLKSMLRERARNESIDADTHVYNIDYILESLNGYVI